MFLALAACNDKDKDIDKPDIPSGKDDITVKLISTTMPERIPWTGGNYEITIETNSENGKWKARINMDGEQGEEMDCSKATLGFDIPASALDADKTIELQVFSQNKWVSLCSANQDGGTVRLADDYWAKGNLTVRGGKFGFEEKQTDFNYLVFHNSPYAIDALEEKYNGKVYAPEEQSMSWASIPKETGTDPCRLVEPENTWITPDVAQLERLADTFGGFTADNGVAGASFADGAIFMPAAGTRLAADGTLTATGVSGGYWGRGVDEDDCGDILVFGKEYDFVFVYNNTESTPAALRCVRMSGKADYVSHEPQGTVPADAFELIVTATSTKPNFTVRVSDGQIELKGEGTETDPVVSLAVPENESVEERTLKIYIDNVYTNQSVIQSGITGYANYVSHTPEGTVGGDAFKLKVKCASDMDSFTVKAYTAGGEVSVSGQGSAASSEVTLDIPANRSKKSREIHIDVNGTDTQKIIVQEYAPESYSTVKVGSTEWAAGNVTLRGLSFEIGKPEEYGLYFRKNSIYGILSSADNYSGTVYSPAAEAYGWMSIPYNNDGDPCLLVAPANTWRTPTQAEIEELHATAGSLYALNGTKGRHYAGNELFIPAAGMMYTANNEGVRSIQGTHGYIRSQSEMIMSYGETPSYWKGYDDYGYSVRCVRNEPFAEYVSHTPDGVLGSEAFTLTVNCRTNMPSFTVSLSGGGLNLSETGSNVDPAVTFNVPANASSEDRIIKIIVNNRDTGVSVTQKGVAALTWSGGYLTVANGSYTFAEYDQLGMFFKYGSRYGAPSGDTTYQGIAYGPDATTLAYADIPFGEVDPCSLVAPAGTWRIPTQAEFEELLGNQYTITDGRYIKVETGNQTVYLAGPSGSLIATTGKVGLATTLYIVTSTVNPEKAGYNMIFNTKMIGADANFKYTSLANGVGTQVRCVK